MSLEVIFFWIVLISGISLLGGVVFSIFFPKFRFWPPPKKQSYQFYISWTFMSVFLISYVIFGILDYNSSIIPFYVSLIVGIPIFIIGMLILIWGLVTLSFHQSLGLEGNFIISGPYKYTRNPQYIGYILIIIGFILFFNSLKIILLSLIIIIVFILLPFAEEPWLRKKYGEVYENYKEKVRRFL
ncbi:MAG: methyltransferase [Candidatus Lokiarchaeota archaeon]